MVKKSFIAGKKNYAAAILIRRKEEIENVLRKDGFICYLMFLMIVFIDVVECI